MLFEKSDTSFFFDFYPKSFLWLKWTSALRCSHNFCYLICIWVFSKINFAGEIDKCTLKKRVRVRSVRHLSFNTEIGVCSDYGVCPFAS